MRRSVVLLLFLSMVACQDVIDVDLPTEDPRLVIDALVRIDDTYRPKTLVRVKASLSSSFFDSVQPARLQEIVLSNLGNNTYIVLQEKPIGSGIYEAEWDTNQLLDGTLQLLIHHNDQSYRANTAYVSAVPIDSLKQGTNSLFGDDETEVLISFTDIGEQENFYLLDFDFGEYLVTEDEFYQGQQFEFSYFYDKELKDGTEIEISLMGVDKVFYNYMNQLLQQTGPSGGPFSTPAATVRGNIINTTVVDPSNPTVNKDKFALGYFAVCQVYSSTITITK